MQNWFRNLVRRIKGGTPRRPAVVQRSRRRTAALSFERLEDRVLLAAFTVPVVAHDILLAQHDDWYENQATLSSANTVDSYTFTLTQNTGVFLDVDARDIGLSLVDTRLQLFKNNTQIAQNLSGFDFEGINPANGISADPSLYADLTPGDYEVRVVRDSGTGAYQLRILFDTNFEASVPVLDSNPGASKTLYLDFDGHAATDNWGTYNAAAFNFGGQNLPNSLSFSPAERLAIRNIWSVVAEDFSPFDLNVTTVDPGSFADRVAHHMVITESLPSIISRPAGTTGAAVFNSFNASTPLDQEVSWVFSSQVSTFNAGATLGYSGRIMAAAIETGNFIAEQFGTAVGLGNWALTSGAANGADVRTNGIMAIPATGQFDTTLNREIWQVGVKNSSGVAQDDIALLGDPDTGLGLRADDHGDDTATATLLVDNNLTYTAQGIISDPTNDLDVFQFEASGLTSIAVTVDKYVNDFNARFRLLDDQGNTIINVDPPGTFDATLTQSLPTGVYYLEVSSSGGPGEAGQYAVKIVTSGLANYPPVAADDDFTTDEATPITGGDLLVDNGHGPDTDAEMTVLTVTQINGSDITDGEMITLPSGAVLTIHSDGTFDYDPNGAFAYLAFNAMTNDSFVYTIADAGGKISSATATIQVTGLNDSPTATNNDISVNDDATRTGNLITDNNGHGTDSDPDVGDVLTVVMINGNPVNDGDVITLSSGAKLTIHSDGSYTYDTNGMFAHLEDGDFGSDTFTYTINDGTVDSNTATVNVQIVGVNSDPIATNNARTTTEDAPAPAGNLITDNDNSNGVDSDPEGQVLTVTQINGNPFVSGQPFTLPSGARVTVQSNGNYVYNPNGKFDSLAQGASTTDSFTYRISDGAGGTATATVTITINGVNDAPVAAPDAFTTTEAATVAGNLITANNGQGIDQDVDGDALSLTRINGNLISNGQVVNLPSGAKLTIFTNGNFSYDPNGAFNALNDGQSQQDSFTYTVTDPLGLTSTANVTIDVTGITQRVFINGLNVNVVGRPEDDIIIFDAQNLTVTFNGQVTQLPVGTQFVQIDGGQGNDQLTIIGTTGSDKVVLYPNQALMDFTAAHAGFDFVAINVETITADGNGGTNDQVFLYDSAGDDTFESRLGEAKMTGPGFSNRAVDFDTQVGRATAGGVLDLAFLYDTSGNDIFSASPTIANLNGPPGSGFFSQATGFQRVTARSLNGGFDRAFFIDGAGNDTFEGTPGDVRLNGVGFFNQALGFAVASATSLAGGNDVAIIIDTPGNDVFVSRANVSFLSGPNVIEAAGFQTVSGRSINGGFDQAFLYDSSGDDVFTASSVVASMADAIRTREALGFKIVAGRSINGGNDTAILFDTPGDDTVSMSKGLSNFSTAATGLYLQAYGFAKVSARAVNGGFDRAFLYDTAGNEVFTATPEAASLVGPGYISETVRFESVLARSSGGADRASFFDSAGDDVFTADRNSASLKGAGYFNQTAGFGTLTVSATTGNDIATITDSPGNDLFYGRGHEGQLTSNGYSLSLARFDVINLRGTQGGINRLDVRDLVFTLNTIGAWTVV